MEIGKNEINIVIWKNALTGRTIDEILIVN